MERNKPKEIRYDLLGAKVVENLQKRHFDAYYCQTKEDALKKAIELIPEDDVVSSVLQTLLTPTIITTLFGP